MRLLRLLAEGRYDEADSVRRRYLGLEDCRDGISPIRVLHDAVTLAGVADMGPMLPLLTGCPPPNANAWRRWRARWPRGTGKPWRREPVHRPSGSHLTVRCALSLRPMPKEIPWPENRPSPSALQAPRTRKPRSRWSVAIACGWRTSSTARSSNSSSRHLSVGDKLPSENEISERYGVSRPVVREALLRLRADGLVTAHQGLGTFVSHQPAPRLKTFSDVEHVSAYLRAQEVRVALEGDAARLAALRRTDEQLRKIEEAHQAFAESLAQGRMSAEADLAFHASIAEASGNDFYLGVLESIHDSISGFMRLTLSLTRTGSRQRAQTVLDEHATILAAIRAQDGEHARVAMQFHLPGAAPAGGPRARLSAATGFSPPKRGTTSAEDQEQTNERFFQTQDPQDSRGTAQPSLVWREGPARVRPPFAHGADGLSPLRLRGQAGDRHHQHLERHQPRHSHFKQRVEEVKRGIWQAGGFPVEMPAMSLSEPFQKPTTMLYRNLLAMETEELLRSYPADGCVLMGGCDKTTPALLMGAVSMDLPTRAGRPHAARQLERQHAGLRVRHLEVLGRAARGQYHRGRLAGRGGRHRPFARPLHDHGHGLHHDRRGRGAGHVPVGYSSIPAPDSRHAQMASLSGKRIVEMVWEDLKPSDLLTAASYDNAVRTVLAPSGSTNSVVHLIAMARRSGFGLDLDRFDHLARTTPVLANLRPAGKYLMEDFYYAGGLRALLVQLGDLLDLSQRTVDGRTLGENIAGARVFNDDVIRARGQALVERDGRAAR